MNHYSPSILQNHHVCSWVLGFQLMFGSWNNSVWSVGSTGIFFSFEAPVDIFSSSLAWLSLHETKQDSFFHSLENIERWTLQRTESLSNTIQVTMSVFVGHHKTLYLLYATTCCFFSCNQFNVCILKWENKNKGWILKVLSMLKCSWDLSLRREEIEIFSNRGSKRWLVKIRARKKFLACDSKLVNKSDNIYIGDNKHISCEGRAEE